MTTYTAFPPLSELSVVGIWVETVLYGVNCVMYALSMFILLRDRKLRARRRVLLVTSTILFLLCTAYVGTSLRHLLDAYIFAAAHIPGYPSANTLNSSLALLILKGILYSTVLLCKDVIQIWRLYVVFIYDWRAIVVPTILMTGGVGSAYVASVIPAVLHDEVFGSVMNSLIISASALDGLLNISVTTVIVARLWRLGRTFASLTNTSANRYASSIYIAIESGAICAASTTVTLVLFATGSNAALVGLDVLAQLDVLMPLLIIVQVGLTNRSWVAKTDSLRLTAVTLTQDEVMFRNVIPPGEDLPRDNPFLTVSSPSSTFVHV